MLRTGTSTWISPGAEGIQKLPLAGAAYWPGVCCQETERASVFQLFLKLPGNTHYMHPFRNLGICFIIYPLPQPPQKKCLLSLLARSRYRVVLARPGQDLEGGSQASEPMPAIRGVLLPAPILALNAMFSKTRYTQ